LILIRTYHTLNPMLRQYLNKKKLPDLPGIYIFRDYQKRPIYIGRATSLKDRTKSYFANDLIETRGPRIVDMVTKAKSLTFEQTDSVLEAVLLESSLIKQYQPYYNVDERDDRSNQCVVITEELWPRVFLARARDLEKSEADGTTPYRIKKLFGPFTEAGLIKESLKILRRLFPFRDKKAYDPRYESFYQAIGRSPDRGSESDRLAYSRTIDHLILFFEGKKSQLRIQIEKDMNEAAKEMRFEDANRFKHLLHALDHINDIALIKDNREQSSRSNYRIEAYDIAHLSGTNVVGAMTVYQNGNAAPAEYRKFKIKKDTNNDIANLAEVIFRRLNHPEWAYPDLIVVDGNANQLKAAENILKARRINISVVAVTKDDKHKASELLGDPELVKRFKREIIAVNAEAHRYAIKYHRQKRSVIRGR